MIMVKNVGGEVLAVYVCCVGVYHHDDCLLLALFDRFYAGVQERVC